MKKFQYEEVFRGFQALFVCFRACFQIISLFSERALLLFKQNFKCIHRWYSLIKGTLKNFANFKGKHLCWSLFTSTLLHLQLFRKFLRICHLKTLLSQKDALSEIFQNIRGGFVGTQGNPINSLSETQKKDQRQILMFFFQIILKLYLNGTFNPKDGHNQGFVFFLQNQGIFLDFQKETGEASTLPPLIAHLTKQYFGIFLQLALIFLAFE